MAARLIRPLYARYDVRTGEAETPRPSGASTNAEGAPRVRPDPKNGTEREPSPLPQPPKNFDDGSIEVLRDGGIGAEELLDPSLPAPVQADDIKVLRDHETADAERVDKLPRNDKIVIEELEREHESRMALGSAKPANRPKYSDDEYISTKTIIQIAAAVIALGLAFTAILPSLFTRDPVEYTAGVITPAPPAPRAEAEAPSVAQPLPDPRPAQAPEAPPPEAASNEATSVAKTAPGLRGSAPADVPADGRAVEQVLLPSAGKAAGRTPLTAEETAAVNRGLEALQKSAAAEAPPPRSAPNRPALTAEEQAAVERGLRELEKSEQTNQ